MRPPEGSGVRERVCVMYEKYRNLKKRRRIIPNGAGLGTVLALIFASKQREKNILRQVEG